MNSGIYHGKIYHRRQGKFEHEFTYPIYMMAIDIDEQQQVLTKSHIFGGNWFNPIRFCEKDYIRSEPLVLKQRIVNKVESLGGKPCTGRILMLVQCRCFGIYFSPINFYFCYDQDDICQYMLAEVSNTPWDQRHYYLIEMGGSMITDKAFHVSPFMEMDMCYHWYITPPQDKAFVRIENHKEGKQFEASLALHKRAINRKNLLNTWLSLPVMSVKIVFGIYWQALKLVLKKIPFISHPQG
ncbi:DUF1365 domain-containing protein [Shewanella sp. VB17]|uniref:DUF1365 domain-containing protein n=1 Tax=Shewanella sp. VB17 TaxID=2739432 RepID=UPI0015647AD9|nr:DUF1365 domain-containing protein [Shewanella sp. VB17]NRD74260.1 DUF1365 domain-containing protein [Shewanella sp. VB17]